MPTKSSAPVAVLKRPTVLNLHRLKSITRKTNVNPAANQPKCWFATLLAGIGSMKPISTNPFEKASLCRAQCENLQGHPLFSQEHSPTMQSDSRNRGSSQVKCGSCSNQEVSWQAGEMTGLMTGCRYPLMTALEGRVREERSLTDRCERALTQITLGIGPGATAFDEL